MDRFEEFQSIIATIASDSSEIVLRNRLGTKRANDLDSPTTEQNESIYIFSKNFLSECSLLV